AALGAGKTEGARDVATRVAADHFRTICQLRYQLRRVEGERDEARTEAGEWQKRAGSLESRLLDLDEHRRGLEQRNLLVWDQLPPPLPDPAVGGGAGRSAHRSGRVAEERGYAGESPARPGGVPARTGAAKSPRRAPAATKRARCPWRTRRPPRP